MSASGGYNGPLEQVGPCQWRIPKSYRPDMRVDGLIFADDTLIEQIKQGPGARAGRQRRLPARHPAGQPGHARHPLGLRLLHRRRRAPTDPEEGGVISPGGVGYDINCGVRLVRSDLDWSEAKDRIKPLVDRPTRDKAACGKYRLLRSPASRIRPML